MKKIECYSYLLVIVLFTAFFSSCKNRKDPNKAYSTFYVVRNAERHPGFNGHLNWYGRLRAGDLMRALKDSGIQKIYVTPFSRTLETADSLKLLQKIDTVQYPVGSAGNILIHLLEKRKDYGKRILIVGHGNTVPAIIRKLGATYAGDSLPAFNLIFEIVNDHEVGS